MSARVAVVTGGASGLGHIFALRMAAQGIRVGVVDRDPEALTAVASQSSNVHPVRCDVSRSEELGGALTGIESTLGTIARLVTCAAIMPTSKPDCRIRNFRNAGRLSDAANNTPIRTR